MLNSHKKQAYLPYNNTHLNVDKTAIDKRSLVYASYVYFVNKVNEGAVFEPKKIFHYPSSYTGRPVVTCFKVCKKISTPLLPKGHDNCYYYITAQRKFSYYWNQERPDEYFKLSFEEQQKYVHQAADVPRYYGVRGISLDAQIIDAILNDDGMTCLVVALPGESTMFDQYKKPIINENFSLSFEYATRDSIKTYVVKNKGAKYLSKFGLQYGLPLNLFMVNDPLPRN